LCEDRSGFGFCQIPGEARACALSRGRSYLATRRSTEYVVHADAEYDIECLTGKSVGAIRCEEVG
jgi:hypothetical protein